MVAAIGMVVALALVVAAVTDQQPFNMKKDSQRTSIDIARTYGIPAAIIFGSVTGILAGRVRSGFTRRSLD